MKSQYETIIYPKSKTSFHFFIRTDVQFNSYWHYHPEIELTFIQSGHGLRYVGDHVGAFRPGDLVLLGENVPHDYISNQSVVGENSTAHVIQFPKILFDNLPEGRDLNPLFEQAKFGIHFLNPEIQIINQISEMNKQTPLKRLIYLLDILNTLNHHKEKITLSSISFSGKHSSSNSHQVKITKIIKYIAENFDTPLSLYDVSRIAGMAPTSFCRWFKKSTGHNLFHYLNSTRIEKACELLLLTDDRISQVAFQVGFESISHFNRTFQRLKNKTPREYRKHR